MLDKFKVALVLVIIGAISGFLIYGTNELTHETIAEKRADQELDFYKDIFDIDLEETITTSEVVIDNGMIEVEIINNVSETVGYVYKGSETNNYGDITVLVGIKLDGTIANVVISQSTNTPTFVKKIKDKFLPKLAGQEASELVLDTRTGASFTYGSVSKFVETGTTYFVTERGVNND
jgi:electron transport complex protein RnfG